MPIVVGINFKKAGRVYYFDPGTLDLKEGDLVIAETSRGIELGEVSIAPRNVEESELVAPLKRVLRLAAPKDIDQEKAITAKEKEGYIACQRKIDKHGLDMKLIDVEYSFDGTHGTFFFSAEGRIDFRELVKDLAQTLRVKVQLHQVGVRDEAKMFGGLGPCGRPLCCATFLSSFEPVSMKMAKEQSLFLNPAKFSGLCGKLMCCLRYEYEVYKEAKGNLPPVGSFIQTPKGRGKVVGMNVIKGSVLVDVEGVGMTTFLGADLLAGDAPAEGAEGTEAPVESGDAPTACMRQNRAPGEMPAATLGDGGGCGKCPMHGPPAARVQTRPARSSEARPPKGQEPKSGQRPQEPRQGQRSGQRPPGPKPEQKPQEPREPKAAQAAPGAPKTGEQQQRSRRRGRGGRGGGPRPNPNAGQGPSPAPPAGGS